MPLKSLTQLARENYGCPHCLSSKGEDCVTPGGRRTNVHRARVRLLTTEDIEQARIPTVSPEELFGAGGQK